MRPSLLACTLCVGIVPAMPAFAQSSAPWTQQPYGRGAPAYRAEPADRLPPLLQLDATALLLAPPPPMEEPPPPQQRPMFSNGWTRDGFGTQQQRGWR